MTVCSPHSMNPEVAARSFPTPACRPTVTIEGKVLLGFNLIRASGTRA